MLYIVYTKNLTGFNEKNCIILCTISSKSIYTDLNTVVAKKLSNRLKKPKFNIRQSIMSIVYKKIYEVKIQFEHHSDSKAQRILLTSMKLLWRCFVS